MKLSKHSIIALASLSTVTRVLACDLCACYTPNGDIAPDKPASFYASVAEQFTHFGSLRDGGHEVGNPTGQHLNSFITQAVLGGFLIEDKLSVQVNVPFIYRSFERPEGFETDSGSVSGIGDLSLLLNYRLFEYESRHEAAAPTPSKGGKAVSLSMAGEANFTTSLNVMAGLKFPTGDTGPIKEEFEEVEVEGAPESGIHGHDLTLGTGSWDGVFGMQTFTRYKRVFFEAEVQYTVRGKGSYSYQFDNDLTWSGGPGAFLLRNDHSALALQCVVSGETKGMDTFRGESAEDTGITSLFVGPRLLGTFGSVSAELGLELPVLLNNTALQAVPDYRIRAGVTFHF